MLATEKIEPAAQEGIHRILLTFTAVPAAISDHTRTGLFIRVAGHIHQFAVEVGVGMHAVDVGFPAVVEALGEVGENTGVVFI